MLSQAADTLFYYVLIIINFNIVTIFKLLKVFVTKFSWMEVSHLRKFPANLREFPWQKPSTSIKGVWLSINRHSKKLIIKKNENNLSVFVHFKFELNLPVWEKYINETLQIISVFISLVFYEFLVKFTLICIFTTLLF